MASQSLDMLCFSCFFKNYIYLYIQMYVAKLRFKQKTTMGQAGKKKAAKKYLP